MGSMKLFAPVAAAAVLVLAACGDDGGSSNAAEVQAEDLENLVEEATPTSEAPADGGDTESSETESSSGGDACSFLTVDEVAAVMGESTATTTDGPSDGGGAGCTWTGPDGIKTIYIVEWPSTDFYAPDQLGVETVPVSGLGDEAVYSDLGKFVLWTQDGRAYQLQAQWAESPTQDDMVGLAQAASGRA